MKTKILLVFLFFFLSPHFVDAESEEFVSLSSEPSISGLQMALTPSFTSFVSTQTNLSSISLKISRAQYESSGERLILAVCQQETAPSFWCTNMVHKQAFSVPNRNDPQGEEMKFTFDSPLLLKVGTSYWISVGSNLGYIYLSKGTDSEWFKLWTNPAFRSDDVSLQNGNEKEDDTTQDQSGLANKTNFTFAVDFFDKKNLAPENITLWTNNGTVTEHYDIPLSDKTSNDGNFENGENYAVIKTFPKGRYGYHFEADGGAGRFPERGELSFVVEPTSGFSDILSEYFGMSDYLNGEISGPHCFPYGTTVQDSCQFNPLFIYTPKTSDSISSISFVYNQTASDIPHVIARVCSDQWCIGSIATSTPITVPAYPYRVDLGKNITFTFTDNIPLEIGRTYYITTNYYLFGQSRSLTLFAPYDKNQQSVPLHILRTTVLPEPKEFEDDGKQDGKGIADKTIFTFQIQAEGDTSLFIDNIPLPLTKINTIYSTSATFPKGIHHWYFKSNGISTGIKTFTTGYSNVAFLPGLEASRLYQTDDNGKEEKLWEPFGDSDGEKLLMNSDGTSIGTGIYTKDVIDNAYLPLKGNIYSSFISRMNDMKDEGVIQDFQFLPYDWRLSFENILNREIRYENGRIYYSDSSVTTPYIIQEIRRLAETSDTGKVTVVAHSMGGLLAKKLSDTLNSDASKLIDQMIFVAVPQVGTPQALGALLHGADISLPSQMFDFGITAKEARKLSRNLPSVYTLIPSDKYFTQIDTSVVSFDSSEFLSSWRNKYGKEIHSRELLHNFLADQNREVLETKDSLSFPPSLNENFLTDAETIHARLDEWTPPLGVELTQIAGWGEETLATIEYRKGTAARCVIWNLDSTCGKVDTWSVLEPHLKTTIDGDGTVVTASALWTGGTGRYWVDLGKYGEGPTINRKHADIFEVPTIRDFIKNTIIRNNLPLPQYILTSSPEYIGESSLLHFVLHSPLTLDMYDNLGNHTGVSTTTNQVEENIPNSRYMTFGEIKYISVPKTADIRLFMNGYEEGSFTLTVEKTEGGVDTVLTNFAGIPNKENTKVSLNVSSGGEFENISSLLIDENGDGKVDFTLTPKEHETVVPDSVIKEEVVPAKPVETEIKTVSSNGSVSLLPVDIVPKKTETREEPKTVFAKSIQIEESVSKEEPIPIKKEVISHEEVIQESKLITDSLSKKEVQTKQMAAPFFVKLPPIMMLFFFGGLGLWIMTKRK